MRKQDRDGRDRGALSQLVTDGRNACSRVKDEEALVGFQAEAGRAPAIASVTRPPYRPAASRPMDDKFLHPGFSTPAQSRVRLAQGAYTRRRTSPFRRSHITRKTPWKYVKNTSRLVTPSRAYSDSDRRYSMAYEKFAACFTVPTSG